MPWSLFSRNSRQSGALRVEVVKTYWCLMGPTRRPITCILYRSHAGLELRTYRGADDLLYSFAVETENQAADQAAAWKAAVMTSAGFTEADGEEPISTDAATLADRAQPMRSMDGVSHVPFSGDAGG